MTHEMTHENACVQTNEKRSRKQFQALRQNAISAADRIADPKNFPCQQHVEQKNSFFRFLPYVPALKKANQQYGVYGGLGLLIVHEFNKL